MIRENHSLNCSVSNVSQELETLTLKPTLDCTTYVSANSTMTQNVAINANIEQAVIIPPAHSVSFSIALDNFRKDSYIKRLDAVFVHFNLLCVSRSTSELVPLFSLGTFNHRPRPGKLALVDNQFLLQGDHYRGKNFNIDKIDIRTLVHAHQGIDRNSYLVATLSLQNISTKPVSISSLKTSGNFRVCNQNFQTVRY